MGGGEVWVLQGHRFSFEYLASRSLIPPTELVSFD